MQTDEGDERDDDQPGDPQGSSPGNADSTSSGPESALGAEQAGDSNGLHPGSMDISRDVIEGIDKLSPDQQTQLLTQIARVHVTSTSGPLPDPGILEKYQAIDPSYPAAILEMAKSAQAAKISEKRIPILAEAITQVMATFGITFLPWLLIIGAIVLVLTGHQASALVAGLAGVVGIIPSALSSIRKGKDAKPSAKR